MKVTIIPKNGFILDSTKILWGDKRTEIRQKLHDKHEEADQFLDNSKFFDGDDSFNISLRRDIYKNFHSNNDILFLNYDEKNRLSELEIHSGYKIEINGLEINFNQELDKLIQDFKKIEMNFIMIDKGSFLNQELKINIADNESMGGDDNKVGYFYFSNNIEHLIN